MFESEVSDQTVDIERRRYVSFNRSQGKTSFFEKVCGSESEEYWRNHGFVFQVECHIVSHHCRHTLSRRKTSRRGLTWRLNSASTSLSLRTASIRALDTLYACAIWPVVRLPERTSLNRMVCRSSLIGGGGRKEGLDANGLERRQPLKCRKDRDIGQEKEKTLTTSPPSHLAFS